MSGQGTDTAAGEPSRQDRDAPSRDGAPGESLAGPAYLRIVVLAAAIGIPAALVAAVFLAAVHDAEQWLWTDMPKYLGSTSPQWYLVLGLPVVGGLLVLAARRLLPGDGGKPPTEGISSTPTPIAFAPGVVVAAVASLAFGAVLGPEMPVIALGSVVGMVAARWAGRQGRARAVLSSAGSFSAISALFGGPLVAGVLLVEGGLPAGAALLPALLPGFVAAAIGYVIFIGFGSWGGLNAPGLAVPDLPKYHGLHLYDLLIALVVGVLAALAINASHVVGAKVAELEARAGMTWLLLGGALAIGVIAEVCTLLGAQANNILFSGQSSVPVVVAEKSAAVVIIVLVGKWLAFAVSLGCGFRGGPIFPAVFLGIGLASLPVVWFGMSPTAAIAIGAAAGMAAQTRLLISPLLFGALLVGTQGLDAVPAAVLAGAAAWLTMATIDQRARSRAKGQARGGAAAVRPPVSS